MEKRGNPILDHIKMLVFVVFLCELVLFFIGVIFGRLLGYENSFLVCFWMGVVVLGCFGLMVAGNAAVILVGKIFNIIQRNRVNRQAGKG